MSLENSRLQSIALARRAVIQDGLSPDCYRPNSRENSAWIGHAWRQCLERGQRPNDRVGFDLVSEPASRRILEANHELLQASQPIIDKLVRAIAHTRYFAILTDAQGVVINVAGGIDRSDRRAQLIARVGVDLGDANVGTTAIGASLSERRPVWLHRGEHFFQDNAVYSCAGAPLFDPRGQCVGMLDLTGVEVDERPELEHFAASAALRIENALVDRAHYELRVRLNWPGCETDHETEARINLDRDGWLNGTNSVARRMLPTLRSPVRVHASEIFALPWESLFDRAGAPEAFEVPMWSGLRLMAATELRGRAGSVPVSAAGHASLKEVELQLIRKTVHDARGSVMAAARKLGISRATIYRKLGRKPGEREDA